MSTQGHIAYRGENLTNAEFTNQMLGGPRILRMYNGGANAIPRGSAVSIIPSSVASGAGYLSTIELTLTASARPDLVAGGALEDIPIGSWGQVIVHGVQTGVNVVSGTAANSRLGVGAANGRLAAGTATNVLAAIYLLDQTGNLGTVYWQNQLGL